MNRTSMPFASYFVTLYSRDRLAGLTNAIQANAISTELRAMNAAGIISLRAWTLMPDHLHVFFRLADRLTLGQVIGRLKAKTKPALSQSDLQWQGNYYEHRLRPDEDVEAVLRYLYLNPYRAKLVAREERYPHFELGPEEAEWFRPTLDDDCPFPEWLRAP